MSLKMKDLMLQTNESKSTILYYLKEGLLPEPNKPKPNVHLYDESCIQIIKFIKYLQHNFSYSLGEIQSIFQENKFDFDSSFEMMVSSLELISGGRDSVWHSRDDFLALTEIEEEQLSSYEKKGYLFERTQGYSSKEIEVVEILKRADSLGLDCSLLDAYVTDAKKLGKRENEIGAKLLAHSQESHNRRYELLFDLVLTLKPYIFNMHTVQAHHHNIQNIKKES